MNKGKFEIFKDSNGFYRFRLRQHNGEIIATSERYFRKKDCENSVNEVKKNAPGADIVEL